MPDLTAPTSTVRALVDDFYFLDLGGVARYERIAGYGPRQPLFFSSSSYYLFLFSLHFFFFLFIFFSSPKGPIYCAQTVREYCYLFKQKTVIVVVDWI